MKLREKSNDKYYLEGFGEGDDKHQSRCVVGFATNAGVNRLPGRRGTSYKH